MTTLTCSINSKGKYVYQYETQDEMFYPSEWNKTLVTVITVMDLIKYRSKIFGTNISFYNPIITNQGDLQYTLRIRLEFWNPQHVETLTDICEGIVNTVRLQLLIHFDNVPKHIETLTRNTNNVTK